MYWGWLGLCIFQGLTPDNEDKMIPWVDKYKSSDTLTIDEREYLIAHPELETMEGAIEAFGEDFLLRTTNLTLKNAAIIGMRNG